MFEYSIMKILDELTHNHRMVGMWWDSALIDSSFFLLLYLLQYTEDSHKKNGAKIAEYKERKS